MYICFSLRIHSQLNLIDRFNCHLCLVFCGDSWRVNVVGDIDWFVVKVHSTRDSSWRANIAVYVSRLTAAWAGVVWWARIGLRPGMGGTRVSGMILPLTPPCLRGTSAATMRRMHLRMRAIASVRRALSNEGPCCQIGGVTLLALRPFGQRAKFSARPWKKTNASNASVFWQPVSVNFSVNFSDRSRPADTVSRPSHRVGQPTPTSLPYVPTQFAQN